MAMKEEIINYFKNDRSYQGGVTLYMKYGNRIGFKKQLNVQVESHQLLNTLHEELRFIAGIDHHDFRSIMFSPVVVKPAMEELLDPQVKPAEKHPASRQPRQKTTKKPKARPKKEPVKKASPTVPQQKKPEKKKE